MIKILVSCLLALSVMTASFASASDVTAAAQQQAKQLRDQALKSDAAWNMVESLTTEVGARLAGTPADKRAVEWAQTLLNGLGFDRVWLEPVEFPIWQRHRERAQVVSPFPQELHITALGYSGSTDGEIKARLISFENLDELKAAPAASVAGKIVLINQRTERTIDGSGYGNTVAIRYAGGPLAKAKGAVAILIRSIGTDQHRFPHTGATSKKDDPLPAAALSAPDADQLQRILARGKPVTVALSIEVSLTPGGTSWNVIGQIDGREKPDEIVLIGAHLDSWDLGTGALDDGAGVGITTAAAELIAQLEQKPKRSIRLILFANEEQGLWGAKAYTKKHAVQLKQHVVASESDFGAGRIWALDTDSSVLMNAAIPVLKELGIKAGGKATSGGPDIRPLMEKGVRIFQLKQDGMDYFDYHHTADDTLDKIDPKALQQNVAAWAVVTYLAAELDW